MSDEDQQIVERRNQQAALYGESVDALAAKVRQHVGLEPRDLARTIGVSAPMFNEVLAGRRVRIGNPVAIARLGMLRDFTNHLISGEADPADIPLTLEQIRASTSAPRPSQVTAVATSPRSNPDSGGPSSDAPAAGLPSGPDSGTPSNPGSDAPAAGPPPAGPPPQLVKQPNAGPPAGPPAGPRPFVGPVAPPAAQQPPPQAAAPPPLLTHDSLRRARAAVNQHVRPTPTRRWPLLERFTQTETWVKHENNNPTGAFKVRGGLTFMEELKRHRPQLAGIISATRGNHGQSLAYAGRAFGVPVTIVVPEGNSPDKNDAMEGYGAELVVHGADYQEAREHANQLSAERGLVFVPPVHPWLMAGVATYAAELHESVRDLDVIYVPVGMGSGICANIAVRDLFRLRTEIVGVVSERAPAYALSFEAGKPVSTDEADTFVDGVACRTPDAEAVEMIRRGASRFVRVSEDQAAEAMALMYRTTHSLAEPSGSLALAGLLVERERVKGKRVAIIQTGGNADFSILERVMGQFS